MEQIAQKSTMQNLEQRDPKAAERGDKPTRRRSHRPRGCRGGSNRRKNKGGENRSSFNKSKRAMGKKQDSFKNQRSSFNKGSNASEGLLTNTAMTKMGQQPGGYEYDQALSLQEFGAPRGDMMYSSGYNSSSSDLYPSGTDLQESLSESSEESGSYPNTRSFHSDSRDMGLILPPMAVNNSREPEPMTFRGPNPYALHPTTNHNISDPRLPVYGMYNNANAQGPEAHKMSPQFYNNGNVYSENAAYGVLATLHLPGLESKMAHHGTKQQAHRPIRAGGSLFCTSPRSFLMGNKKTDFVTRSE